MNFDFLPKQFHDTTLVDLMARGGPAWWVVDRQPQRRVNYRFQSHYHPYTDELIETLNTKGLDALLDPVYHDGLVKELFGTEETPRVYQPDPANVDEPYPKHEIDVSDHGPYAIYNWELFFHAPVLIGVHLSVNQRFEEAQRWFHRVFDPTSTDTDVPAPQRFWKFLRFRNEPPEFIAELLTALARADDPDLVRRIEASIWEWREKPFQPHVVARGRYLAYQLYVLMKYLDNLLAWGDSRFRQDTVESLNEATQIYVLAANLLGPKPQKIPPRHRSAPKTYAQLKAAGIDAFRNALIEVENELPFNAWALNGGDAEGGGADAVLGIGRTLYFCIPQNHKLLRYWDQVADRLFKIRHCTNIEGLVRQLPLFDPPIDPGVMVRAAAAGLDVGGIVNNINQPLSTIRGPVLLQKALELCSEVRALGGALLSAIEKGDAERMALLRQRYELNTLSLARDVRFLQWKEAEAATEALLTSRATVWERYRHYKRILGAGDDDLDAAKTIGVAREALTEENFDAVYRDLVERYTGSLGREAYRKETSVGGLMEFAGEAAVQLFGGKLGETLPLNKNEDAELNVFLPSADAFSTIAMALNVAAPVLAMVPQFDVYVAFLGVGGKTGFGGVELSSAAKYAAEGSETIASAFRSSAERASRLAGYYRRAEDFVLQANLAASELEQYGRQVIAALLREQVLKREYDNHLKQINESAVQEAFLREKFTNHELYAWMQAEVSRLFFDSYTFAYDVAKRAELTLKHEVMRPEFDEQHLIKFGYWDSARKGLLAGDTLYLDLRRLEMAYLEQNRREYEMTRHVSLMRLDPLALLRLKATGACEVEVPEWLFDMDSPGQYMRRLKTVAISIPCVTGPYTGVHCKLALLRSSIRVSAPAGEAYLRREESDDTRFRNFGGAIESIVTSTAQNDPGVFDINLRDERHLPFEGAGAISAWRIELPNDVPQFDFETIADVVLHLRYTAREAGHLRSDASERVKEVLETTENLVQLFCLNHDFAGAWHLFGTSEADGTRQLSVAVRQDQFPYWTQQLAMGDGLMASFAVIDRATNRLMMAPATAALALDVQGGWALNIGQDAPVFSFLVRHVDDKVYMAVSCMPAHE